MQRNLHRLIFWIAFATLGLLFLTPLWMVVKGGFFVGAGVVLPVMFWGGETETGDLLPKINLGYRGNHFNVTAYLLTSTEEMFKDNLIGLSAGYRF